MDFSRKENRSGLPFPFPSSILNSEIPWTEEPGRLQSVGSQRVRHDWAHIYTHTHSYENQWTSPHDFHKSPEIPHEASLLLILYNRDVAIHLIGFLWQLSEGININFPEYGKYSKVGSPLFYPAEVIVVANSRKLNLMVFSVAET